MPRCTVWYKFINFSEEFTAFIFRVEEQTKLEASCKESLLDLFFDSENRGDTFPRSVGKHLRGHTASHHRTQYSL
jgi:hypothetical protein